MDAGEVSKILFATAKDLHDQLTHAHKLIQLIWNAIPEGDRPRVCGMIREQGLDRTDGLLEYHPRRAVLEKSQAVFDRYNVHEILIAAASRESKSSE